MNRLSPLDRIVIALAAHPREHVPQGRIARLLWRLRYGKLVTPLASPHLEALRRLAAYLHAGGARTPCAAAEASFLKAGWQADEIAALRPLIIESSFARRA